MRCAEPPRPGLVQRHDAGRAGADGIDPGAGADRPAIDRQAPSQPPRKRLSLIMTFSARVAFSLLALFAALLAIGCEPASKLPTVQMQVGNDKFTLEVADDDASRETGLMNRDSMGARHGMLFVFDREQPLNFWMKDTRIPLDIL